MLSLFSRVKAPATKTHKRPTTRRATFERLEDRSMLSGGTVVTSIPGYPGNAAIASYLDSAGNLVAAGAAFTVAPTQGPSKLAVLRYHADGTPDTTFGSGGAVTTAATTNTGSYVSSQANAVVAYPPKQAGSPDRILAAGLTSNSKGAYDFALARYNADGSLDTTFNPVTTKGKTTGGIVQTNVGGSAANDFDTVSSLLVQGDGKIVALGTSNYSFALARYTSDGKLDSTFGAGGIVKTSFAGSNTYLTAAAWDQGKILAVGSGVSTVMARYNLNGTLDTTFGSGGLVNVPTAQRDPSAVVVDSAGSIFVAGHAGNIPWSFAVAKYNDQGLLDDGSAPDRPLFGTGGLAIGRGDFYNASGRAVSDVGKAIALQPQPDGTDKIVVGGYALYFAAARFNADGSLDTTFGGSGTGSVTTPILNSAYATSMVFQPGGKIILAGRANDGTRLYAALARYTADGILDTSFGSPSALAAAAVTGYANLTTAQAYEPTVAPTHAPVLQPGISQSSPTNSTLVFSAVAQTAGTTAPSTGGETKGLQPHRKDMDYEAVDAALEELDADLLASALVP